MAGGLKKAPELPKYQTPSLRVKTQVLHSRERLPSCWRPTWPALGSVLSGLIVRFSNLWQKQHIVRK